MRRAHRQWLTPQAAVDAALKRHREMQDLARKVRFTYNDEAHAWRLEMAAWDELLDAVPEIGRLRHTSSHLPGGIYHKRPLACPRCRGKWARRSQNRKPHAI